MSNFALISIFAAAGSQTVSDPKGDTIRLFGTMIFMFIVVYFVMIRPQQKRTKQHDELLKTIAHGDKVVTSGGIVGVIVGLKEKTISIRSADTKLEIQRSAISQITEKSSSKPESKES